MIAAFAPPPRQGAAVSPEVMIVAAAMRLLAPSGDVPALAAAIVAEARTWDEVTWAVGVAAALCPDAPLAAYAGAPCGSRRAAWLSRDRWRVGSRAIGQVLP